MKRVEVDRSSLFNFVKYKKRSDRIRLVSRHQSPPQKQLFSGRRVLNFYRYFHRPVLILATFRESKKKVIKRYV